MMIMILWLFLIFILPIRQTATQLGVALEEDPITADREKQLGNN